MRKILYKPIMAITILLGMAFLPIYAQKTDTCLALSDGKGTVNLLWFPAGQVWPAGGWQIQSSSGIVLLKRVFVAEEIYLTGLAPTAIAGLRQYAKALPQFKDVDSRKSFFFSLRIAALTDFAMARALGFSRALEHVAAGAQSYQIVGLDAAGKAIGPTLKSPVVDGAIATPQPAMPVDFRAVADPAGVLLFWTPASVQPEVKITYYLAECTGDNSNPMAKRPLPILLNESAPSDRPRYNDASAPVEQEIAYRLSSVDAFGRRSTAVECKVYSPDFKALAPPDKIQASAGKGIVNLTWQPNPSPNTRLIFVERCYKDNGTYISLTPKGLPRDTKLYADTTVPGGVTAYYRVRCSGQQGVPGNPSVPVSAKPQNPASPPVPIGLKADAERTRIHLTWQKSAAVAVFFVIERKTPTSGWSRINPHLEQETQYDDTLGEETGGTYLYRLKALAFDNQESAYCNPVQVVVPERSFPPTPLISGGENKDGMAIVHFTPGLPESRSASFLVLRSGAPDQPGVVLGRPLPAHAREYTDPFVRAGETYFYRVVALNAKGNRSEPSEAVLVTVGAPPLPQPQLPKLQLLEQPFKQIKITFPAPPAGLGLVAVAERKLDSDTIWLRLPGSTAEGELLDPAPPKMGRVLYRVIFIAPNGMASDSSPLAEIVR